MPGLRGLAVPTLLLFLVGPLAGCFGGPSRSGDPPVGNLPVVKAPELVFTAEFPIDLEHRGGEPSVLVDPKTGDYYASAPSGFVSTIFNTVFDPTKAQAQGPLNRQSFIWKSTDKGATWKLLRMTTPPLPPLRDDITFGGADTDLAADACGNIYFTDLWLGNIAVSHSRDGGATWDGTPLTGQLPILDRNWLAADTRPNHCGVVYLLYQTFYSQLWVLRSTDFGMTWPEQNLVMDGGNRTGNATGIEDPSVFQGGNESFGNDGPLVYDPVTNSLYFAAGYTPDREGSKGVWVFHSQDDARTWSRARLNASSHVGNVFPVVAVDGGGIVYVAWSMYEGGSYNVYVAKSPDEGQHWSPASRVSGPGNHGTEVFPWITAGDLGRVAVAWYGVEDTVKQTDDVKGDWHVYVTASEAADLPNETWSTPVKVSQKPMHRGPICTHGLDCTIGGPSNGMQRGNRNLADFFETAIDKEGRFVATWSSDIDSSEDYISHAIFGRQTDGFSFFANLTAPAMAAVPEPTTNRAG